MPPTAPVLEGELMHPRHPPKPLKALPWASIGPSAQERLGTHVCIRTQACCDKKSILTLATDRNDFSNDEQSPRGIDGAAKANRCQQTQICTLNFKREERLQKPHCSQQPN